MHDATDALKVTCERSVEYDNKVYIHRIRNG